MQLFPDAHPATLHTVLMLCNNDFYSAVDTMLYAKKCKLACADKKCTQNPQNKKAKIETVVVDPHLNSAEPTFNAFANTEEEKIGKHFSFFKLIYNKLNNEQNTSSYCF